jgi:hypothetical protein
MVVNRFTSYSEESARLTLSAAMFYPQIPQISQVRGKQIAE